MFQPHAMMVHPLLRTCSHVATCGSLCLLCREETGGDGGSSRLLSGGDEESFPNCDSPESFPPETEDAGFLAGGASFDEAKRETHAS